MSQSLTALQVKEQNSQAYDNLEKTLKDLHKENLDRFMQLYGYVNVDHVIKRYIKYSNENGTLILTEPSGSIYHWDTHISEWIKKGSIFVN